MWQSGAYTDEPRRLQQQFREPPSPPEYAQQPLADAAPEQRPSAPLAPPLAVGAVIALLVGAEGVALLSGAALGVDGGDAGSPMRRMHATFVEVLGAGDVAASLFGLLGLLAASAPPALLARALPSSALGLWAQAAPAAAFFGVGALLVWRALAAVAVAPWAGFAIAFATPETPRAFRCFTALAYTALAFCVVAALFWVLGAASRAGRAAQAELRQLIVDGSAQQLVAGAAVGADARSERLFGYLPLEVAVASYAICVGVMSMWLMAGLAFSGDTGAGWAFFGKPGTRSSSTFWMEALMYTVAALSAALAASAIFVRRRAHLGVVEDSPVLRKRCAGLLLVFLVAGALRFGLSVPVTGMALAAENLCGLYVAGLSAVALDDRHLAPGRSAPVRCSSGEFTLILVMLVTMALDGYMLLATLRLWAAYRASFSSGADRPEDPPLFGRKAMA